VWDLKGKECFKYLANHRTCLLLLPKFGWGNRGDCRSSETAQLPGEYNGVAGFRGDRSLVGGAEAAVEAR
jgi:hypothetical protein